MPAQPVEPVQNVPVVNNLPLGQSCMIEPKFKNKMGIVTTEADLRVNLAPNAWEVVRWTIKNNTDHPWPC
jgi:hypothetical protein